MSDEITKTQALTLGAMVLVRKGYSLTRAAEILRDLAQNDSEMDVLSIEEYKRLIQEELEKAT